MSVKGKQLQEICSALLDGYPTMDALSMMVRFELDENLEAIVTGADLRTMVYKLATWADKTGRIDDLVEGAYRQNPGNAALQLLAQSWRAAATPPSVLIQPSSSAERATPTAPESAGDAQYNTALREIAKIMTGQPQPQRRTGPNLSAEPSIIEWVTIPAGEFLMSSNSSSGNKGPHAVYLPEYRIAKHAVTNALFMMFVKASLRKPPQHWHKGQIPRGKENHPVVNIDWIDACQFCAWAGVRLPTEEEWEKAARGTDGRTYPWGNGRPSEYLCNFNGNVGDTTPVGAYPKGASPYGVLDMPGNVWEWTSTPSGGNREIPWNSPLRILRGGSHGDKAYKMQCAYSESRNTNHGFEYLGFRVVAH